MRIFAENILSQIFALSKKSTHLINLIIFGDHLHPSFVISGICGISTTDKEENGDNSKLDDEYDCPIFKVKSVNMTI